MNTFLMRTLGPVPGFPEGVQNREEASLEVCESLMCYLSPIRIPLSYDTINPQHEYSGISIKGRSLYIKDIIQIIALFYCPNLLCQCIFHL